MKKTNKLISVLLVMAMLLSMIPLSLTASAADTPTTTTIDGKVFYQLSTADDLYWFASQANGVDRTINGILLNDITVNTGVLASDGTLAEDSFRTWTPICTSTYYTYAGIFDGNGFAISGLFNNTKADYVGLFGYVKEATIKNLGIKDSYFYGGYCVGAVAGCSWSSTISNCYNTGTIKGVDHVGGVVGYNRNESTLTNSYNTGEVTGTEYIGGVVGYNSVTSTLTNSYNTGNVTGTENVGGVAGISITESTVSNSYNTGNVTGDDEYIGGVVGQSGSNSKITNSHNTGDVTGFRIVGGVAGESRSSSTITNSYNTGTVTCENDYVGGVVGTNSYSSTVINCYNTGTVNCTVGYVGGVVAYMMASATATNCYNTGTVNCTGDYVGGVVGRMLESQTETNTYYLATCGAAGSGTSATADQFASGYVAYHLNGGVTDGTQAFYQNIDNGKTVDAIPKLTGGTVYAKKCVDTPYGYSNSVKESLTAHTPPEGTEACADYTCTICSATVKGAVAHTPPEGTVVCADYTCTICGTSVVGADSAHSFVNGFGCTLCSKVVLQPAVLVTEDNYGSLGLDATFAGYYAISNAGQLYWFAAQVNSGNTGIMGVLLNDITVNENVLKEDGTLADDTSSFRTWTPIGTDSNKYNSIFNGNGKVVRGLYYNNSGALYVGLFGVTSYATIKNVGVEDSYFYANKYVGGVAGEFYRSTVTNCYNTGVITATESYAGGVVAMNWFSNTINCYNTGRVTCRSKVGGITGYNQSPSTVTNSYYLDTCGAAGPGTGATADQFASGYVAYHLNGGVTDGTQAFYQNIDNGKTVDAIPKLTGGTVYKNICVDTAYYGNTAASHASHTAPEGTDACEDYTCTVCNAAVTAEAAHTPPETWDCTVGYTCTVCGAEVAATAHTAPEGADCTVGYDCTVCGEAVKATDHDYISVVTPPTETEEGYTTYTCSVCGHEYVLGYVAYDIKGTVTSFGSEDDAVTIELVKSGETTPAYTKTVVGTVAEFSLNGIEAGEYTLKVSKENHVSREYNVTVDSALAELELKIHLLGDINGDGKVNTIDVARTNSHAKSVVALTGYELACADVNNDNKVNTVDVARMNAHAKGVTILW